MERKFLLFLVIALGFNLYGQQDSLWNKNIIKKNKVRTVTFYEYDYVNGKPEADGVKTRIDSFDTNGQRVLQTYYRENGLVLSISTSKYDSKGNRIFQNKQADLDGRIKTVFIQNVRFDSKGNRTQEFGYNGIDSFKNVYNYNKLGKLAEVNFFIKKRLDEKRVFTNNTNSSDLKILDGYGSVKYTQKYLFNASDKILQESTVMPDNTESQRLEFTYDGKDNVLSETKYLKGKLIYKISYVYKGGLLSEMYKEGGDGVKFQIAKYAYDASGNMVEEQTREDAKKDFSKSVYTYDKNNLCKTIDSYFAKFNKQVLTVVIYQNY